MIDLIDSKRSEHLSPYWPQPPQGGCYQNSQRARFVAPWLIATFFDLIAAFAQIMALNLVHTQLNVATIFAAMPHHHPNLSASLFANTIANHHVPFDSHQIAQQARSIVTNTVPERPRLFDNSRLISFHQCDSNNQIFSSTESAQNNLYS